MPVHLRGLLKCAHKLARPRKSVAQGATRARAAGAALGTASLGGLPAAPEVLYAQLVQQHEFGVCFANGHGIVVPILMAKIGGSIQRLGHALEQCADKCVFDSRQAR
jgi:hypothetical protein